MKRKSKIFLSLVSLCFSVAVLCFGVYSALSVSYLLNGSVSYELNDVLVKIELSVYSLYLDRPITETENIENITQIQQAISLPISTTKQWLAKSQETTVETYNPTTGEITEPPQEGFKYNGLDFTYGSPNDVDSNNKSAAYAFYIVLDITNYAHEEIHAIINNNTVGDTQNTYFNQSQDINISAATDEKVGTNRIVLGLALKDATIGIGPNGGDFSYSIEIERGNLPNAALYQAEWDIEYPDIPETEDAYVKVTKPTTSTTSNTKIVDTAFRTVYSYHTSEIVFNDLNEQSTETITVSLNDNMSFTGCAAFEGEYSAAEISTMGSELISSISGGSGEMPQGLLGFYTDMEQLASGIPQIQQGIIEIRGEDFTNLDSKVVTFMILQLSSSEDTYPESLIFTKQTQTNWSLTYGAVIDKDIYGDNAFVEENLSNQVVGNVSDMQAYIVAMPLTVTSNISNGFTVSIMVEGQSNSDPTLVLLSGTYSALDLVTNLEAAENDGLFGGPISWGSKITIEIPSQILDIPLTLIVLAEFDSDLSAVSIDKISLSNAYIGTGGEEGEIIVKETYIQDLVQDQDGNISFSFTPEYKSFTLFGSSAKYFMNKLIIKNLSSNHKYLRIDSRQSIYVSGGNSQLGGITGYEEMYAELYDAYKDSLFEGLILEEQISLLDPILCFASAFGGAEVSDVVNLDGIGTNSKNEITLICLGFLEDDVEPLTNVDIIMKFVDNNTDDYGMYILQEDGTYAYGGLLVDGVDELVIPKEYNGIPVTSIARYAFGYGDLDVVPIIPKKIVIPNTITKIEDYAFSAFYGGSISEIVFEENSKLTTIGYEAFSRCDNLSSINIPSSVISIGDYAFSDCTNLSTVTFRDNSQLESIGSYAFSDCTNLSSITIPSSVRSIGYSTFDYCINLSRVDITDIDAWAMIEFGSSLYYAYNLYLNGELVTEAELTTATKIGDLAFSSCTSLTSITIPSSVTSIGYSAFTRCTSLSEIYIDGQDVANMLTTIDSAGWLLSNITTGEKVYIKSGLNVPTYMTTNFTKQLSTEELNGVTYDVYVKN